MTRIVLTLALCLFANNSFAQNTTPTVPQNATLMWDYSEIAAKIASKFELLLDGLVPWISVPSLTPTGPDPAGNLTYSTPLPTLPEGSHAVAVRVCDGDMRCASSDTLKFAVSDNPPPPVNQDCVPSDWAMITSSTWSVCGPLGAPTGTQTRTEEWARTIITPQSGTGLGCGSLTETRTASQSCVPGPVLPPLVTSADGTRVPPAEAIVDSALARWTISPESRLLRNGIWEFSGSGTMLVWKTYQGQLRLFTYGTDQRWYLWTNTWTFMGLQEPGTTTDPLPVPTDTAKVLAAITASQEAVTTTLTTAITAAIPPPVNLAPVTTEVTGSRETILKALAALPAFSLTPALTAIEASRASTATSIAAARDAILSAVELINGPVGSTCAITSVGIYNNNGDQQVSLRCPPSGFVKGQSVGVIKR